MNTAQMAERSSRTDRDGIGGSSSRWRHCQAFQIDLPFCSGVVWATGFLLIFVIPLSLPAISYGDLEKPLHGKLFASLKNLSVCHIPLELKLQLVGFVKFLLVQERDALCAFVSIFMNNALNGCRMAQCVLITLLFASVFGFALGIVTGSVSSAVQDAQGALVAGEKVTARHVVTNHQFTTVTTSASSSRCLTCRLGPTVCGLKRPPSARMRPKMLRLR